MINFEKIHVVDLQQYGLITAEDLSRLRSSHATDHEIKRAIGVVEQLKVSFCARRERLPSVIEVHAFTQNCVALDAACDEETVVVDAVRAAHVEYLRLHPQGSSGPNPSIKESVVWAMTTGDFTWHVPAPNAHNDTAT